MTAAKQALKPQVTQLYKELLWMGRDYPQGYKYFRDRCHKVFKAKSGMTDPKEIENAIKLGEYVKKELEALYFLKRYRAMKRAYYD